MQFVVLIDVVYLKTLIYST